MRFRDTLNVDEAEVLAGDLVSVSGRHYVLYDLEKLPKQYTNSWKSFALRQFKYFFIISKFVKYIKSLSQN